MTLKAILPLVAMLCGCGGGRPAARPSDTAQASRIPNEVPSPPVDRNDSSSRQGGGTGAAGPGLEDVTQQLGPFPVGNQRFTVFLRRKHITGVTVPDPEFQTTLAAMEIRDQQGRLRFEQAFRYEASDSEFPDILDATVELLQGRERAGLLVTYSSLPSTPLGGSSWQILGLFDDSLVPFSKAITLDGDLLGSPGDSTILHTVAEPGLDAEVINFKIWSGNFFVVYPVRVDFVLAKAMPAWRCTVMTPREIRTACSYRVVADRSPSTAELTFVRLFGEPAENSGTPEHVVIRQASRIEILAAQGEIQWQEDADNVGLNPGDDFWLKVRIDGKEGWIHTQEDFEAIGLPQAG